VLLALFQNFAMVQPHFKKVNADTRVAHARELLGEHYEASSAHRAEKNKDLNFSIFSTVYENLPIRFKDKAVNVAQVILDEAEFFEVDPIFVLALIKTESKFNPRARGSHGEIGLMQIKPETAEWIAERESIPWKDSSTLEDPVINIRIGMAYINYLRMTFSGSANKYLSAYNMGARNVRRLYASEVRPREYSVKVMRNYEDLYSKMAKVPSLRTQAMEQ
jgi:soluble lytic murein transglycosylase